MLSYTLLSYIPPPEIPPKYRRYFSYDSVFFSASEGYMPAIQRRRRSAPARLGRCSVFCPETDQKDRKIDNPAVFLYTFTSKPFRPRIPSLLLSFGYLDFPSFNLFQGILMLQILHCRIVAVFHCLKVLLLRIFLRCQL